MQAIILAAGMGKRLGKLTQNNTKCMVEVGGVRLIERALYILDKKNLSRIVMVVGYQCENLMQFVDGLGIDTPVEYIINEVYDRTNNIYSLSMTKDLLVKEDTLLLESDLAFGEALIDLLLEDSRETLALVDKFENWMDGTCLVVDEGDRIVDFIPGKLLEYSQKERYKKLTSRYGGKNIRYFARIHRAWKRAAELLEEQILIKDLTGKIANGGQYVRIAVRSRRENE